MPPLAPRPFYQLAARHWRLYRINLTGYGAALNGGPWLNHHRRRSRFVQDRLELLRACQRRGNAAYWFSRPLYLYAITGEVV